MQKKRRKDNKAITLIALVITIIVLLILAGVTIAALSGDNGILQNAGKAKEETEKTSNDELRKLTQLEAATHLEEYEYEDKNGDKAPIPAGFAVSQIKDENIIEEGLVIIDKNGNEFVWIPVPQENFNENFVRRTGYFNGNLYSMANYGEVNAEGKNVMIDGINTGVIESDTTIEEAKNMYKGVYDNEGFYIGRYEAGKNDNGKVVVKKGVSPYTNVQWSKNGEMNEEKETSNIQEGAIELARSFYVVNNYTTVRSTLCYGVQWDRTLSWIDVKYEGFAKDSTGKGNYNEDANINEWKGTVTSTGASEKYKTNNIYDMAGNVREWTMETHNTNSRIGRGRCLYF